MRRFVESDLGAVVFILFFVLVLPVGYLAWPRPRPSSPDVRTQAQREADQLERDAIQRDLDYERAGEPTPSPLDH